MTSDHDESQCVTITYSSYYLINGSFAERLGINSYTKLAYVSLRLNVPFDLAADTGPEGIEVGNFHAIPTPFATLHGEQRNEIDRSLLLS